MPKWLLSSDKSQKPLSLLLVTFDSSWLSNLGGDGQLGELRGGEKEVNVVNINDLWFGVCSQIALLHICIIT